MTLAIAKIGLWGFLKACCLASLALIGQQSINWGLRDSINEILPGGWLLRKFLVPRTPDSTNHRNLQIFIKDYFLRLGWHFEEDVFNQDTVIGKQRFVNLIATSNILASKRIVIAAHYDSKRFVLDKYGHKQNGFIGATDSAWPCALLLHLASELDKPAKNNQQLALQIILFDGEEALEEWGQDDSIYGAKHLAAIWNNSTLNHQRLGNIRHFLLLDLLGAKDQKLFSLFPSTQHVFDKLAIMERSHLQRAGNTMFVKERTFYGQVNGIYSIEDDHVPFAKLGVLIVHLIPLPFPSVWHTMSDDESALDSSTCRDLAIILKEYLKEELLTNSALN